MGRKQALGFTLVELAVVILLISIFMGLGLSALDVQQTNRAYSETREKQEKIKDALVFHLSNFRRLPCPDTTALTDPGTPPDGKEDRETPDIPTARCVDPSVAVRGFGVIPYLTLGLSRDDALDGWDNFFSYQVSLNDDGTSENEEWSLTDKFAVGNAGSITLNERDPEGAEKPLNEPPPAGLGIAAIIVSHGRNGSGAFTTKGTRNVAPPAADEVDNTNADSDFFQREFTDVDVPDGGPFDDLVLALTPTALLTPAIKDGALRSGTAQALSQIETIVDTVIGSVRPSCKIPNAVPLGAVATDPWGKTINYGPNAVDVDVKASIPPASDEVAFRVWSSGPDRVDDTGGGDDVGLTQVNYGQLRTAFSYGSNAPCP